MSVRIDVDFGSSALALRVHAATDQALCQPEQSDEARCDEEE